MRVLGLDIETTGLDHANDHVTELAWVIKDVGSPKPLEIQSHFISPPEGLFDSATYLKPQIQQLTKITMGHLIHGKPLEDAFRWLVDSLIKFEVEAVVAHNGENFDKPFLQAKTQGFSPDQRGEIFDTTRWIDTSVDIVYPEDCRYTNLMYVAAYHGILNPFPHAALFDVMTMLKVLDQYDPAAVAERARSPWCVVQALVSYDNRQLAKEKRFYWETIGTQSYPKKWVKRVKECDLDKEIQAAPFKIERIA